ncbi:hypothetical protein ASE93_12405 [Serratia sp. Leaf50]|nr:hypothetical protein ASE93_12405 [Serratia sp. Leaf50]
MASGTKAPLLNPILSFLKGPTPTSIPGGGKNSKGIVLSRLEHQKLKLVGELQKINDSESAVSHGGKLHLLVKMFEDSLAPSWTPDDLFDNHQLSRIIAPAYSGYLVEVTKKEIPSLINKVRKSTTDKEKVDISRLESIVDFNVSEALRNLSQKEVFARSEASGHQFNLWVMPYYDQKARYSVIGVLEEFVENGTIGFGYAKFDNLISQPDLKLHIKNPLEQKLKKYSVSGKLSLTVTINNEEKFNRLLTSGVVYRLDPVSPMTVKSSPPGIGNEPKPRTTKIGELPTVVIIDGGCSAASYLPLNIKSISPLVSSVDADLKHGNQVTSVICQGFAWNNKLALPPIECSFISIQAINKRNVVIQPTPEQFVMYLRGVANETNALSKVWNLSFNEERPLLNDDEISFLGHEINKIARDFGILPIISIGNVSQKNSSKLCPPADCESALTISGRLADSDGLPSHACPISLKGPAPAGMKKPELSWFSTLRMIGGTTGTGSSFSAPLISSIAAHSFKNLKDPTPDLVKALLINKSERHDHDSRLGWGTPWAANDTLPWLCEPGSVTLAWNAKIKAGAAYYWNDIPIPPEMLVDGKIRGEITLTAILKPLVSELGGSNYFSTRLQCALQSVKDDGNAQNLLGSMKESKEKEIDSRKELAKWSPVRHHGRLFSGVSIENNSLRLFARIFARDLYQYGYATHHELKEHEISVVLTFKSNDKNSGIYNSMKQNLGIDAEIATIEQDIDIEYDDLI